MAALHHLDLNVSDLVRSSAFYAPLFERLGWARGESGSGWEIWAPPSGAYVTLVQTPSAHRAPGYHRKRTGLNHLAFGAPSRAAVDALHAWLLARGVPVLYGGPKEMGTPAEPNYAVFFEDPDRVKLEVVFRPGAG